MKSIKYCLNKQLAELCKQSVKLEELAVQIAHLLPSELASHCQVGSFNKGCLTLITTDPVWATQLHYALPELRDALRKKRILYQLNSIKVTTSTPLNLPTQKKKNNMQLSTETKALLITESERCTYQPLSKALLHLAGDNE